jgi:TP901 family phage tail tape measure protein
VLGSQVRSVTVSLRADIAGYVAPLAAAGRATAKFAGSAAADMKKASTAVTAATGPLGKVQAAAAQAGTAMQSTATRYTAAAKKMTSAAREAGSATLAHAEKNTQAWGDLSQSVGVASAAIAAGAALAIKGFADFDAQMSRVAAAADANAKSLDQLRVAALEAGKATKFSATEAAQAEEELVKAGISVRDIVTGGLRGSMSLAAAGNLELADAAELAAQAMNTFSLEGKDVPRVADTLAAGAGKAAGSVHEMGMALKQTGLVASQLGLSIEDTVGTLSAFADNALVGSDAGTSLKTALSFLQPKSDAAGEAMRELGLDFYDANGQFVGIISVAGQLQERLGGLTQEQRNATLYTIFGSDAIRAANILYKEGSLGIASYIQQVKDQGYASRVAAKATDNLKGDIEKLGGSIETALIGSGGGGSKVLRELAQGATEAVDAFEDLPGPVKESLVVVGLLAGVLGLVGAGFLMVVPRIAETKAALATMNVTAAGTRARMAGLLSALGGPWGIALTAAAAAVGYWAKRQHDARARVQELNATLDEQTGAITKNTREWVKSRLESGGQFDAAKELGLSLKDVTDAALGNEAAVRRLDAANRAHLKVLLDTGFGAGNAAQAYSDLRSELTGQSSEVDKAVAAKARLLEADGMSAEASQSAARAAAENAAGLGDVTDAATETTKAEEELRDALDSTNNQFLVGRDAQRDYKRSLADVRDALKENGRGLDDDTEKGMANAEVLDAQAEAALGYLETIYDAKGAGKAFQGALKQTREDLIRSATALGMSDTAARKYADAILKIPARAATEIAVPGAAKAIADAKRLYSAVRSLPMKKTITLTIRQVYQNYGGESAAQARYERAGLVLRRAEGGPVPGHLGTPGRDSVPALLTPREYVIPAKPAVKYRRLLDAIRVDRVPGYAAGGPVGRSGPRAQIAMTGTPQVVMVPVQETHTTSATVHVGTVNTRDAGSFVGWSAGRSFDATRGVQ